MKTEYELRFFKFPKDTRKQLVKLGFSCVASTRIMKVKVFHFKKNKLKWGRVRDEGNGVVKISIKERILSKTNTAESTREVELKISSFKKGEEFLTACGLEQVAYQEKNRESWKNDEDVEVEFDTWPGLPEMIEIEALTKKTGS